jgi:predicted amidohydrolase YtcJ
MNRRTFLKSAGASAICASRGKTQSQGADVLVLNGRVATMNARQPFVEALAIAGGKIVATGSTREITAWKESGTQVIDVAGHLVIPGLTDCHIHFLEGALTMLRVHLEDAADVSELQQRIRDYATSHPGMPWIQGRGWVYSNFGEATLPHKRQLDAVVPDRPAYLRAFDGHSAWVNSKALALAGITKDTPDPAGSVIVRDPATGEPTGVLKERPAQDLIRKVIPAPSDDEKLSALRAALTEASRVGLARVHSAAFDVPELALYSRLRAQGDLTLRFYMAHYLPAPQMPEGTWLRDFKDAAREYHDDWLHAGAVKFYLDGVIESHTAVMLAPYTDGLNGKMFWDPDEFKKAVTEVDRLGYQIFTHAIGDGAVRLCLDAYQAARSENKSSGARNRVEHMEAVSAADITRFRQLGVIASMQPLHADPGENILNVWSKNVGSERATRGFAWESILKAGGHLAFGSDWPVVTQNPFKGLQVAVTRQTDKGRPPGGWQPQQRVGIADAVRAYTIDAAFAGFREKTEGSLESGKVADFLVLSQDVFKIAPSQIGSTDVLLNCVGGKFVHRAPGWS